MASLLTGLRELIHFRFCVSYKLKQHAIDLIRGWRRDQVPAQRQTKIVHVVTPQCARIVRCTRSLHQVRGLIGFKDFESPDSSASGSFFLP